ncbi:MAG: MBL fold metallo-hydrolase [Bilophila wadsworthia]
MLKPNGAAELTAFTEKSYKETITPIVPGIWHVLGVGHSNAVIIEGRTSVILVDTLDTLERGQKLLEIIRSRTEKPVKTILYTHVPGSRAGQDFPVRTRKSSPSRQQPLC